VPWFGNLFYQLLPYSASENVDLYQSVLVPWRDNAAEAMSVLEAYGSAGARKWRKSDPDLCSQGDYTHYTCLEHLYALSRVSDLLVLHLQPATDPKASYLDYISEPVPKVAHDDRNEWLWSLGMREVTQATFHPFYHEIVEVEQSPDPNEPISLVETLWPGFMLGHMMFCRAGVRVWGGVNFIRKDIAENSRLYWTYLRRNRHAVDDSHGWGHNSQWVTDFRRDYEDEDAYYYNVDGNIDGAVDVHDDATQPDLPLSARIELLTNRCFIVTPERFYDEDLSVATYREPR
jgi:hypothetical protein